MMSFFLESEVFLKLTQIYFVFLKGSLETDEKDKAVYNH